MWKTILILLAVAIILAISMVHVYRSAELHELHKLRAAFDRTRIQIKNTMPPADPDGKERVDRAYDQGEIDALSDAIKLLDSEEASIVLDWIHRLKNK